MEALTRVAMPGLHMVRGTAIPQAARDAIAAKGAEAAFGEHLLGYVKDGYRAPDPETAINVTADWTCHDEESLDELRYWWQRVGTDAFGLEEGLLRRAAPVARPRLGGQHAA